MNIVHLITVLDLVLFSICRVTSSHARHVHLPYRGGGAEIKWRSGYARLDPNSDYVISMSLLRYVRQDYFSRRLLAGDVGEDREHSTNDVALKSVEDLPTPGNTWKILQNWTLPTEYQHEHQLEASLSTGKLYRVPIPFFGRHLVTTSSPKHVSEIFRNEGEVPCRLSLDDFEQFMVEKGFMKGIVIS